MRRLSSILAVLCLPTVAMTRPADPTAVAPAEAAGGPEEAVVEDTREAARDGSPAGAEGVVVEPPPASGIAEATPLSETSGIAEATPLSETSGDEQAGSWGGVFNIALDGHLRVEASTFLPDRFFGFVMPSEFESDTQPQVGRNDGFGLAEARFNLRAVYRDNLYVRLGFDGALATYADNDSPVGTLTTGLTDAYMRYTFAPELHIVVGRFKPPFDVEELAPSERRDFVHRALESHGEPRHAGAHADLLGQADNAGFAPRRQLGVMIGSDAVASIGSTRLGYALAMTNGNSGDATLNDNDLPAFWLRLFAGIGATGATRGDEEGPATYDVRGDGMVGLSAFYNEITTGVAPKRYRDRVVGAGVDVAYNLFIFRFRAQALAQLLQPVSRDDIPIVYSFGGHAQLAVDFLETGFFPAYRFAVLDPRVVDDELSGSSPDIDRVMHHTIALSYRSRSLPLVFWVEYTRSVEQPGRRQANDRVEAAMQVTFR